MDDNVLHFEKHPRLLINHHQHLTPLSLNLGEQGTLQPPWFAAGKSIMGPDGT